MLAMGWMAGCVYVAMMCCLHLLVRDYSGGRSSSGAAFKAPVLVARATWQRLHR
jgi:hypothetical protein